MTVLPIHSPLAIAIGMPFIFLQTCVSSFMALTKTDVRQAVKDLFEPIRARVRPLPRKVGSQTTRPLVGFKPVSQPCVIQSLEVQALD
jgi:hypothetical protein